MVVAKSLKKVALSLALLGSVGVAHANLTLDSWTADALHLNAVWTLDGDAGSYTFTDTSSLWDVTLSTSAATVMPGSLPAWYAEISANHAIAPHAGEPAPGPTFSTQQVALWGYSAGHRAMRAHDGSGAWVNFNDWSAPQHWDHYGFRLDATAGGSAKLYLTATHPVPEPESYAMLLAGLGLMGMIVRRRSKHMD